MRELRDAACEYLELGWHVFPVMPGAKRPDALIVPRGMNDATDDPVRALDWWEWMKDRNIGIHCQRSGLVVLDIDPRHGGTDSLKGLIATLGPLPATVEAFSGGGGRHLLFVHGRVSYRRELAPGVDIKANGYIILPPSIHPSGERYEWATPPKDLPIAHLPERWHRQMSFKPRAEVPALGNSKDWLKRVPADVYFPRLTGRRARDGWVQCPFHKEGQERTPSLLLKGTLWACYACEPQAGKLVLGGNIFDLAGLLMNRPLPLSRQDYKEVRNRLQGVFPK